MLYDQQIAGVGGAAGNNGNVVIPGGGGNPTGANKGGNKTSISSPLVPPSHDIMRVSPFMPTGAQPTGAWGSGGIGSPTVPGSGSTGWGNPYNFSGQGGGSSLPYGPGLNAGYGATQYGYGGALSGELNDTYGHGFGNVLNNYLDTGAGYNAGVASQLLNQFKVPEMRGRNAILDSFGDEGLRFSSTAATGLGWFESDLAGKQDALLANEYDQAQNRYLSLIESISGDMRDNNANQANIFDYIGMGLDIGGSVAGLF